MDFSYSDEQAAFRREFRAWLEDNLPEGWTDGSRTLPDDDAEREAFLRDWQRTLHEGGWAGIHWPAEYGGRDATILEGMIYDQELARVDAPPQLNSLGINLVGPTLMECGTEAQRERFLPRMLDGTEIWCQGFSEPGAGSDVASLRTTATERGDGFRIDGQKVWTSYAHLADWCFLLARTDDSGTKHEGITAFLVDVDQDAIETNRIHQIDDDREFDEVYFDGAVARREHVVGEVDDGWRVAMTLLGFEHSHSGVFELERRFEEVRKYCTQTTVGDETLIEKPLVRQRLAAMHTRIQAAKITHYRSVSARGESGSPGPAGSMKSLLYKELKADLEALGRDLLGVAGACWGETETDRRWADEYLWSFGRWSAGGTADVQRNIIAEGELGLPKDPKSEHSHTSAQ